MIGFSKRWAAGAAILAISGGLAACASQPEATPSATQRVAYAFPVSADALVGRWGLGSFHEDADRARTEIQARSQCHQPYVIGKGSSGGVTMHLADSAAAKEVFLSGDPNGRTFIGPSGATPEQSDLQILSFDRKVMVARWIDAEVAARYGTMIYVRCGA
jgi:hypothetical protein